jgi:hypothetical protein
VKEKTTTKKRGGLMPPPAALRAPSKRSRGRREPPLPVPYEQAEREAIVLECEYSGTVQWELA